MKQLLSTFERLQVALSFAESLSSMTKSLGLMCQLAVSSAENFDQLQFSSLWIVVDVLLKFIVVLLDQSTEFVSFMVTFRCKLTVAYKTLGTDISGIFYETDTWAFRLH